MKFLEQNKKRSHSSVSCCVRSCSSRKDKNLDLSFHKVPNQHASKGPELRRKWLNCLRVTETHHEMFVCSLHFKTEDYYLPEYNSKFIRILKNSALPFVAPSPSPDIKVEDNLIEPFPTVIKSEPVEDFCPDPTHSDKFVQVNSEDFPSNHCQCIKTDDDLITMCDIKSFKMLSELAQLFDSHYPRTGRSLLSAQESIILAATKVKLEVSYKAICVIFGLKSEQTVRNNHSDTTKKLAVLNLRVNSKDSKFNLEVSRPIAKFLAKFQKYE